VPTRVVAAKVSREHPSLAIAEAAKRFLSTAEVRCHPWVAVSFPGETGRAATPRRELRHRTCSSHDACPRRGGDPPAPHARPPRRPPVPPFHRWLISVTWVRPRRRSGATIDGASRRRPSSTRWCANIWPVSSRTLGRVMAKGIPASSSTSSVAIWTVVCSPGVSRAFGVRGAVLSGWWASPARAGSVRAVRAGAWRTSRPIWWIIDCRSHRIASGC